MFQTSQVKQSWLDKKHTAYAKQMHTDTKTRATFVCEDRRGWHFQLLVHFKSSPQL